MAGHQRRKEQVMTHCPTVWKQVRKSGRTLLVLGLATSIAACSDTGEFVFGSRDAAAAGPAPISAARQAERDVEAPEVFDIAAEGLWDGRPSLGGVWVAHPDATDPERVIIRNTDTGSFVIGALFRRERDNPGPEVQISSEAAAALDILAGAPTNVQVTALRREEAPAGEEQAPQLAASELPEATETVAAADTPEDAPAIAAATLAAVTATSAGDIGSETTEAASRPFFRRFATPATATVVEIPRNMTAADVAAGITRASFSPGDLGLQPAEPSAGSIEAVAAAAITDSEITSASLPQVEVAPLRTSAAPAAPAPTETVAAVAPPRAPAAASTRTGQGPEQAFVQIGLFSVQENANNTGQTLRNAGLVPTITEQTSNGRQLWRVVVGPAPTTEDRAAVLETVRGLGFEDAYFVAR
jgi:rare lipoprotein A